MKERFLVFEHDSHSYHCRQIQEGVRKYCAEGQHNLSFLPLNVSEIECLGERESLEGYGAICWLEDQARVEVLRRMGLPFLNLCESQAGTNTGLQLSFRGEGEAALGFFTCELEIENLIFVGREGSPSHRRRLQEFQEAADRQNLRVASKLFIERAASAGTKEAFEEERLLNQQRNRELEMLLENSPKPVGVFCGNDRIALNLFYLARRLGYPVPEHVCILGVGSAHRPEDGWVQAISVVQLDHIRQGYEAARLMEQYLSGTSLPSLLQLAPDGIAHRRTTPRRAVRDPLVRRAFDIIDNERNINVNELSMRLGVSRRTLSDHFISATRMSVSRAIDLERFRQAKQLLRSHHYSHEGVAIIAGYRNHRQMVRSFERLVQMSPRQFCRMMGKR